MTYHTQGEEAKISISQWIFVFINNAEYEMSITFFMTNFCGNIYGRRVPSFSVYRRDFFFHII